MPTWDISLGGLPPGLSLNATTGVLSGTPTTAGSFEFVVLAENGELPDDSQTVTVVINPAPITGATVTVSGTFTYTGATQTPASGALTVTLGSTTLVYGTDFHSITATNNTSAGTATVTVIGAGNFVGTATGTFTINKAMGATVSGAPTVSGTPTQTSITVNAVTNAGTSGQAVEYAISTTSSPVPTTGWQSGTTFTGLTASTTYYVFARTAETPNFTAGAAQVSAGITTAAATTPITSGAITATAPLRNATVASTMATLPNTTTGAITWTHPGGAAGVNFGASRVYTAVFTLTADAGFSFDGLPADTLTVASATSVTHPAVTTGNTVEVTVVFPATAAAPGGGGGGGGGGGTPPVITITAQPEDTIVTQGDIDSNLYVTATATQGAPLSYRWYRAADANRVGASTFTGTTSATFPKPADLTEGTHYFYVVISATGASSVRSNVAIVTVTADGTVGGFPFVDVPPSHWARGYVEFVWEQGIMQGVSDTLFAPNTTLSRAMAATILWRTAGEPAASGGATFTDVADGRWYTEAIAWANENGIVLGVGGNRFNPTADVTRQEFAAMMFRYAAFTGGNTDIPAEFDLSRFQDRDQLSGWAERYLYWANYNELITGRAPATLAPQGTATRAEAAGIVYRFVAAFG